MELRVSMPLLDGPAGVTLNLVGTSLCLASPKYNLKVPLSSLFEVGAAAQLSTRAKWLKDKKVLKIVVTAGAAPSK